MKNCASARGALFGAAGVSAFMLVFRSGGQRQFPGRAGRMALAAKRLIDRDVVVRHPLDGKAALEGRAHPCPVEPSGVVDGSDRLVDRGRRGSRISPWSITSGAEPRGKAMTGVPQAMASIMTRPNGSGQSIGKRSARRLAEEARLVALADLADVLDQRVGADQGLDLLLPVGEVGVVDLGGDLQRDAGAGGDLDGAVGALLRRDAAEEGEIAAGRRAG